MASKRFSSHGFEYSFEDNTGEIMAAFRNAEERALMAIGEKAVDYAKRNLTDNGSVDTGRLRNSITYVIDNGEVYIGTNVEYAPYVEFGTGRYVAGGRPTPWVYQDSEGNWHWTAGNPAKPYLAPAAKDHTKEYRELMEQSFENA